jgi:hypothetical protein
MSLINDSYRNYIKLVFTFTVICFFPHSTILAFNTGSPRIGDIVNLTHPHQDSSKPFNLYMGDYFCVQIDNAQGVPQENNIINKSKFTLYFDGMAMNGIKPDKITYLDTTLVHHSIRLFFKLIRDSQSYESWKYFFQYPLAIEDRAMTLYVGYGENQPYDSDKKINLVLINKLNFTLIIGLIIVLFLILIVLAANTNLLKNPPTPSSPACYSLAKTQLAFWNFVVAAMALYIWTITGDCPYLSQTALILIGISTITIAGSKFVDKIHSPDNINPPYLETAKLKANSTNQLPVIDPPKVKIPFVSQAYTFIMDILSDSNGLSVNRVQMVLWSIIIFIFLLQAVVKNLIFPELPDSLLILTGISNGTYVLLKTQEK